MNPTIAYGSILYLRVASVKKDYDDGTMSIHNNILTCLAGDYDQFYRNIERIIIKIEVKMEKEIRIK